MLKIPDKIRREIIELYLNGYSYYEISSQTGVSEGTAKNVIDDMGSSIKDLTEIREITKRIRTANIQISELSSAINLIIRLKRYGLDAEFLLIFLELAYTESFRFNIDLDFFFIRLRSLYSIEKQTGIKIENLSHYMQDKIDMMKFLDEKIKARENEIRQLYKEYHVKEQELNEYLRNRAKIKEFMNLKNIGRLPKELEWIAYPHLYQLANNLLSNPITPSDLYRRLNRIYHEPNKYTDVIREIMKI